MKRSSLESPQEASHGNQTDVVSEPKYDTGVRVEQVRRREDRGLVEVAVVGVEGV